MNDEKKDRAIGSFIGLAVGDALGTTVEFKDRGTFPIVTDMIGGGPFRLAPGQWTDDTSMAVCLSESLLNGSDLDERDLMNRFLNWYENGTNSPTGRCFDIGNTTVNSLLRFKFNGNPIAGSTHFLDAGNGSIMRLAPAVIRFWKNANKTDDISARQSKTTHGSKECVESCILLSRILGECIDEGSKSVFDNPLCLIYDGDMLTATKVKDIANGLYKNKSVDQIKSSGYVIDTLEAACWAIYTSESFEEAVLKAVNLGDDADTVGAVTGQIAGALWGYSAIPTKWLETLYEHDRLVNLSEQLYLLSLTEEDFHNE